MANKANSEQDQVSEETQGGAEQPQENQVEQPQTTDEQPSAPQAEAPQATTTAPGTPVSEVKRTPSLIADTNKAKASELRVKYDAQLTAIGNNMSEKIRFLHREGLSKGDISRVLQIQFQFVRNVTFNYEMKLAKEAQDAAAKAAAAGTPAS